MGHEGLRLLKIWLLGDRTRERGCYKGYERRQVRAHLLLAAGVLKQVPQILEDFATLPPEGQRGDLHSRLFLQDASQGERVRGEKNPVGGS